MSSGTLVLAVNGGSSSLKLGLYRIRTSEEICLISIEARRIGITGGTIRASHEHGETIFEKEIAFADVRAALTFSLQWLRENQYQFEAVGHRVVHGGRIAKPALVSRELVSQLRDLVSIDPEHVPQALSLIEGMQKSFPALPQVACFDTTFHHQMPEVAQVCPLPLEFREEGVLRYGFHGLSYEYVMSEIERSRPELVKARIVIAHLGNGASMAAVHNGKSQDTTMGFTPTSGLPMGTRSGDIDPGVLLYLLQEKKMSAEQVNNLLNRKSGLLGISGLSEDMQDLLAAEKTNTRAALAVKLFCTRATKYIGAYAATLGGLDLLVFTGGIGEHSPAIRDRICSTLSFMGLILDANRNTQNLPLISANDSHIEVRVIHTNEELIIARHTVRLIKALSSAHSLETFSHAN